MQIKDIIEKLQNLNEEEFTAQIEFNPIVDNVEYTDGTGLEIVNDMYIITLQKKAKVKTYKNINGVKKYKKEM